jgi:hypothetical protein
MYELGLAVLPIDSRLLGRAVERARRGVEHEGRWLVEGVLPSPVLGARGAREWVMFAHRALPMSEGNRGVRSDGTQAGR